MTKPAPLKITHLKAATKRWVEAIRDEFALESHDLRILLTAAEMWDRSNEARLAVEAEGLVVKDRYGQSKCHPAAEVERSSKVLFLRAIAQLGLNEAIEPPTESEFARKYLR